MKLIDIQDKGKGSKGPSSEKRMPAGHNGKCTKGHERQCRLSKSDPEGCECECGGENHGAGLDNQKQLTQIEGLYGKLDSLKQLVGEYA